MNTNNSRLLISLSCGLLAGCSILSSVYNTILCKTTTFSPTTFKFPASSGTADAKLTWKSPVSSTTLLCYFRIFCQDSGIEYGSKRGGSVVVLTVLTSIRGSLVVPVTWMLITTDSLCSVWQPVNLCTTSHIPHPLMLGSCYWLFTLRKHRFTVRTNGE